MVKKLDASYKVLAIVQARMGSKRLPNKMLLSLNGYPVIKWIFHRISKAKKIDKIVFAIPEGKKMICYHCFYRERELRFFGEVKKILSHVSYKL